MSHRRGAGVVAASALLVLLTLTACAPEPSPTPTGAAMPTGSPDAGATATATPGASPRASSSATPAPTGSATPGVYAVPTDCRAMVNSSIITQLGTTPLNDPAAGVPTGVQPDGSIVCLWRDPRADTTGLLTTVSLMSRGPALDMLNQLADTQGFTCFTPDGGTRCEKTWPNTKYPVTDGRTLFWRDGILIDTTFSNLAPVGYTDSIVHSIFG